MYNSNIPSKSELPSTGKLITSTVIAMATAGVLLVTVVLPSEYAIDPTGVGRVLGLTEMGEIKTQLAEEAAADRAADKSAQIEAAASGMTVGEAEAAPEDVAAEAEGAAPAAAAGGRQDELRITLAPGEGAEVKLVMKAGGKSNFAWTAVGGPVNVDVHGDGGGKSISYKKDRNVTRDDGVMTAEFDGNHGWFWRNRGDAPVTVIVKAQGAHSEMKRAM
ncbi:MAG: transmembrane anchor protein [Sphingopyxis sp.]|jgi:hypothetical protein|uniref:transmembrane anchor protein n=1 Tax=unclassified Sphingopyxis TaxID=2614943 RepID=UPI001A5D5B59|nr:MULTISPECIES: transmembrane anchor protein [unclassified Sphingopyxis]MBL9070691.1 transmembrane anchor protein [Sphingopyxis sp.]HEV7340735.1 transmembrane anchor protein [Sphingopyxis sp.]